jgi:hypothetical protein
MLFWKTKSCRRARRTPRRGGAAVSTRLSSALESRPRTAWTRALLGPGQPSRLRSILLNMSTGASIDDLVEAPPAQNAPGRDRGEEERQVENAAAGIAAISPSSSSLLPFLAPRRTRGEQPKNRENSDCAVTGMWRENGGTSNVPCRPNDWPQPRSRCEPSFSYKN